MTTHTDGCTEHLLTFTCSPKAEQKSYYSSHCNGKCVLVLTKTVSETEASEASLNTMHVALHSTSYIHCSFADKSKEAGVDKKRQRQSSGEAWLLDMDAKMKGM